MPQPIAQWNPTRMLWETETMSLFSALSEPYSATFPTSGMTRNGALFPLPASTHPTAGSGSSSLPVLPTPTTCDHKPTNSPSDDNRHSPGLGQVSYHFSLLPTPRSQNGEDRNSNIWARPEDQPQNLENALARVPHVEVLLPTPNAVDGQPGSATQSLEALAEGRRQAHLTDLPRLLHPALTGCDESMHPQ